MNNTENIRLHCTKTKLYQTHCSQQSLQNKITHSNLPTKRYLTETSTLFIVRQTLLQEQKKRQTNKNKIKCNLVAAVVIRL